MKYASTILTVPFLLAVRTFAYFRVFRLWKQQVSFKTALLIAAAPLALFAIPLPLPFLAGWILALALATFLAMKFGSVPLFPEALVTCLAVELGTLGVGWLLFEYVFK